MKRLLFYCFIAVIITTATSASVSIEKTVKQVQNILEANSGLPRLSKEEIIDLLNEIRAEDAKSSSSSVENQSNFKTKAPLDIINEEENEINTNPPKFKESVEKDYYNKASPTKTSFPSFKSSEPTLMVVLPYTPKDGASLQDLYTRPPRVEVVPLSQASTKPSLPDKHNLRETFTNNAKLAEKKKQSLDLPTDLQAFLDSHGLKGNPQKDHFLLPLDGFKPMPSIKAIDESVQLPENILLTYDLISPSNKENSNNYNGQQTFYFEPLNTDFTELDTSPSEIDQSVLPLDFPEKIDSKDMKSKKTSKYAPIEFDSYKVLPLQQGPNPIEDGPIDSNIDFDKRQTNSTKNDDSPSLDKIEVTTSSNDTKEETSDRNSAPVDAGASIADLESSFGGEAPLEPGDSMLPPPKKNGFYWMVDWNSFLEVGDGDTKVNIRFEPKLGDPQMFLPISVP